MRKWICLVATLVLAMCMLPIAGGAVAMASDDTYYVVEQDDAVQFLYYGDFGEQSTFYLPAGYTIAVYDKASKNGVDYAKVRFAGFEGYVVQSQISALSHATTIVDLPKVSVEVEGLTAYTFEGSTRKPFDIDSDAKLYYLGTATVSNIDYYAVYQYGTQDVFFVVQAHANREEVEAAVHPMDEPDDSTQTDITTTPPEKTEKQGFTWMRFALILGIVIPLISIIVMIVRPRQARSKQRREVYEDTEDYDGIDEV